MQSAARQLRLFTDSEEPGAKPGFSVRESKRAKRQEYEQQQARYIEQNEALTLDRAEA